MPFLWELARQEVSIHIALFSFQNNFTHVCKLLYVIGSYFGGYFSQYVDDDKLKKLFSLTMLVLGLRTFVSIPKI